MLRAFATHAADLMRLAAPVVVARSGLMLLMLADTVMVGRYSAQQLGYLGIAMAPIMPLIITSIGMLMGTLVLTASAYGAGRDAECGAVWRRAVPMALVLGVGVAVLCSFGEELLRLLGQGPDLVAGGGPVVRILSFGLPGFFVFVACTFFLEGVRRPVPGMILMLIANVANVALNWVLIGGHLGAPALGAVGAAWATSLVRTGLGVGAVTWILTLRDRDRFAIRRRAPGGWAAGRQLRRIGYATGAAIGVESAAFGIVNLFAGALGPAAVAAYTVSFNLFAMVFMVAIGLGAATAVRVGMAAGRGDDHGAAAAGWTGLAVDTLAMAVFAVVFLSMPATLAGFYTGNDGLTAAAAALIAFSAWILTFDGGQAVMANALRGCGETWATTALQTFAYFGVMVPGAWLLAFAAGHGVRGLYEGILVASMVSAAMLCLRFAWVVRRFDDGGALFSRRAAD